MNHNPNPLVQPRKGGQVARAFGGVYELQAFTGPGKVIEVMYQNFGVSGVTNLQLHDADATPADAVAPMINIPISAATATIPSWGIIPWEETIAHGAYVCASQDPDQKTIDTGASLQLWVRYERIT